MAHETPYMPQGPAADFLNLSPRTLERFRVEGRGPRFRKFGKRVVYSRVDLEAWADAQIRTSTSDLGKRTSAAASLLEPTR